MTKHVPWTDICNDLGVNFGFPAIDDDKTLVDVFNDPPRSSTAPPSDQQRTMLLFSLLHELKGLRRAIDRLPAKTEKERLKAQVGLATAERKAAEARERAALAELDAKFAEPPSMIQCDSETLDSLDVRHIRRSF